MRRFLFAIVAFLVIANCLLVVGVGYFFLNWQNAQDSASAQAPHIVSSTPRSVAIVPRPSRTTVPLATPSTPTAATVRTADTFPTTEPASTSSTLNLLLNSDPPSNDRVLLAQEYKGVNTSFATPAAPKQYHVGDQETFWVNRDMEKDNERITATLRYMNNVVYMWVENGIQANDADLKKSADNFAFNIYPTDRKYLGSEANPGVDNDPHLHILNTRFQNASGYFSASDTLPNTVNRQSNQKEMFYINTQFMHPGTQLYDSVLAHEFAHMIHRNQNPRGESSWITEGFGDMGMELNGYQTGHEQAFSADPDLQLDAWAPIAGMAIPHYGAAYLFMSYQFNRFGAQYIHDIFSTTTTGIATIQRALDKDEPGLKFDDVFADWVVANFVNLPNDTRYGYGTGSLDLRPTAGYSKYPVTGSDTVDQYGTDYIQLLPNGNDVTFSFDGSDTVPVIPMQAHSGKYVWWGGRTDFSDTRLTHAFDLSNVKKATLEFWTWYSLEENYDYGYASVSRDGGKTWTTLKGISTTDSDPNAANYGNAFNCESGVGCGTNDNASPQWIQEQMDLTPYVGQKILIRFEQITDEVYAAPGLVIDDISIPEIGFHDDAESGDNGWQAEGFTRMDNVLPQHFILQAIEYGPTTNVVRIPLDAQNRGNYTTHNFGKDVARVVIVVSGSTPVTWETASYQYRIQ